MLCDNAIKAYFHKVNNAEACAFSLRDIYCLAVMYHRSDLTDILLHDIKCTAGECPGVYELPVEAIVDILADNASVFWDEDDALYLAKKWLFMSDGVDGSRLKYANDVLSKVRFQLLSRECLEKEVYQEERFQKIEGFCDFVKDMLVKRKILPGENFLAIYSPARYRDCDLQDRILVILKDTCDHKKTLSSFPNLSDITSMKSKIELEASEMADDHDITAPLKNKKTLEIPPLANKLLLDMHAETISQYLFCVTSYLEVSGGNCCVIVDLFAYDFLTKVWCKLPSPKLPRVHFATVSYNKCLYMIGGQLEDTSFTPHVEMYSPKENAWKTVSPLPKSTAHCKTLSSNGNLYVIGGFTETGPSGNLHCLRAGTLEWETLTPSPFPFIAHQVVFQEPYIVVINADPRCVPECRENCLVAFYNLGTKQWTQSLVKRQTTLALKAGIFDNPVLEMLIADPNSGLFFTFQEQKMSIWKTCVGSEYSEVRDMSERFELIRGMDQNMDHPCHLIAATVVRFDGKESRYIRQLNRRQ